jgi:hypothetical protein
VGEARSIRKSIKVADQQDVRVEPLVMRLSGLPVFQVVVMTIRVYLVERSNRNRQIRVCLRRYLPYLPYTIVSTHATLFGVPQGAMCNSLYLATALVWLFTSRKGPSHAGSLRLQAAVNNVINTHIGVTPRPPTLSNQTTCAFLVFGIS